MKILFYINVLVYILTAGLYISVRYAMFGMYAQVLLGLVQLLSAAILFFFYRSFTKKIQKNFIGYWLSAIMILSFIIFDFGTTGLNILADKTLQILFVFVIPMIIATHFIRLTYLIQRS